MTVPPPIDADAIQAVGVDWSGASARAAQRRSIWIAVVRDGRLTELESGMDRDDVRVRLAELARSVPATVIGMDFAFSFPRWYLHERGWAHARAAWDWAESEERAETARTPPGQDPRPGWTRLMPEPFWGPHIRPMPTSVERSRHFRRTELASARPGATPQSPFKLTGAGAVGSQSLRGMAQLARMEGVHVWPFDDPGWPLVVEVFPRLFVRELRPELSGMTGAALVDEALAGSDPVLWGGREQWRDAMVERQDAFDAVAAAWGLWASRRALVALPAEIESTYRLEGRIFSLALAERIAGPDALDVRSTGARGPREVPRPGVRPVEQALAGDPALLARDAAILFELYRVMRDRPGDGPAPAHPAQPQGSAPVVDIVEGPRRFTAHWVAEGLVLCNLPFAADQVDALADLGVATVINMCEDSEYRGDQRSQVTAAFARQGMVEHRLATSDGQAPSSAVLDLAVDVYFGARRRGAVAVHCLGGRERSATVAAAIRTRLMGEPPEDAVDAIEGIGSGVCPLPGQMAVLVDWAAAER